MRSGVTKKHKRIFKIWQGMRQRCNNPHDKDYERYGGRGIKVCSEWDNSSEAFIEWALQNGYSDDLSIDRRDVNGNYCPENCHWATATEQVRNRRIQKSNTSGVNGVHYEAKRNKFRAIIYADNKKIDLGRYDTLEKAAEARKQGEIKYWGVGA